MCMIGTCCKHICDTAKKSNTNAYFDYHGMGFALIFEIDIAAIRVSNCCYKL